MRARIVDMGYWQDARFAWSPDGRVVIILQNGKAYYVGAVAWGWGTTERYWASVEEVS